MPTAKKKPSPKKAAVKRAPAKSTATKVTRVARSTQTQMRSFRPAAASELFFTFRLTRETLYWLILSAIVLALGIWVTNINIKVQTIYDQIDQTNRQILELDTTKTRQQ